MAAAVGRNSKTSEDSEGGVGCGEDSSVNGDRVGY